VKGWLDPFPPLPPDAWLRQPPAEPPFPLAEPSCRLFRFGRHALFEGIRSLDLEAGDQVLVPAYHHGSEVEALIRSGLECRFYAGTEALEPDEDELEELIGRRVRALHLTHYLGFPQNAPHWRRWCHDRGLLLIEDAAQAWLSSTGGRPVGSFGEVAIFSVYKTVGVAYGGVLFCPAGARAVSDHAGRELGQLAERHLLWLLQRSPLGWRGRAREGDGEYAAEADFDLGDPGAPPSTAVSFLLPRLADPGIPARRRAAYRLLLEGLAEHVPQPFRELPPGASPFLFPIETDDKRPLLERLARQGVGAADLWSVPHPSLPVERFRAAARRRSRTLGLPVHQGLGPDDLERIVAAVAGSRPRPRDPIVERAADLDELRDEWSELAEDAGNIFATWEWCSTWWRHFGAERNLFLAVCRGADGRPRVIMPLCESAFRGLRALRFLGHGAADQLGPICHPGDTLVAARSLRRALRAAPWPADLFVGDGLPGEEGWGTLLGGHVLERSASPVVLIEGRSWEEYLADRSRHFRKRARAFEHALAERYDLRCRLANDATLERDLDTLVALHSARWSEGRSTALAGGLPAFHREFAAQALERGWLRLWVLELDGRPAAALYAFRFGAIEWAYQSGRDVRLKRESPGFVLYCHAIREAMADGMREYRFLLGAEAYKWRFADQDPGLERVALPTGAAGRAALAFRAARRAGRGLNELRRERQRASDGAPAPSAPPAPSGEPRAEPAETATRRT